jgi:hypothetical protein
LAPTGQNIDLVAPITEPTDGIEDATAPQIIPEDDINESSEENETLIDSFDQEEAPQESRYSLRHPKRYPTSTVFSTFSRLKPPVNDVPVHGLTLSTQKADIVHHMSAAKALRVMKEPAIKAIVKELYTLHVKGVWEPVDISALKMSERRRIIRSSMFIKEKYRGDGSFEKLKARLVAGGHMQDRSDMGDVSSPVVSSTSVNILAAIAAHEGRHVYTVDIGSAYLNSDMSGDCVLMKLSPELADILVKLENSYEKYLNFDGSLTVHLVKALYGCVKSSSLWYMTLSSFLTEIGFKTNAYDRCVMNKMVKFGGKLVQCSVCWHVDDLFLSCLCETTLKNVVKSLIKRFGEVTVHTGLIHNYLGAVFDFRQPGEVRKSMPHHTKLIVDDSKVEGKAVTPAGSDLFDIHSDATVLNDSDREWVHSFVHRIMYLANIINFECLTACAFLSSRTRCPTQQDMNKLTRLLCYLKCNPSLELTLRVETAEDDKTLIVQQYTDASYGVHADGKSHSGSCITLGKGAIHARSVKQKICTKSSTEAELVALSDEASRGLWCVYFLEHQGHTVQPLRQHQDNLSAMIMAEKGIANAQRTRHIKIRYFWIKDYLDRGEISIVHCPTEVMHADTLTKPLQGKDFITMRAHLLHSI